MNIAIISLGCPKNQVDADVFCHALIKAGHQTVADPEQADIIIVNTCGFIQSAKEEAIENILMACQYKQQNPNLKVIVTGCLAERYKTQIVSEMPEVDAVVGIGSNAALPAIVERLTANGAGQVESYGPKCDMELGGARVISTPRHYAYLKIAEIRALLPGIPVLALTATATPEVVKDIQARLDFREENVFRMSFERKNLAYIVRQTDNKTQELLHILRKIPGSAIIYVRNRRRTKEITELLVNEDITADFYHAGLDNAVKDLRQKRWQSGEVRVMVATNAFGMGIDKPDVRIVLHLDLPDSPEAYFQEAGRAGRDGEKAYAVILYTKTDRTTLHRRVVDTFPDKEYILNVYEHLQYYYQMAMGDGFQCVREFNLEEFCRKFKYFPVPVDSALKILTQAGYLEYTDEQDNASRILFTIRRDELYKLREMGTEAEALIQTILRSYTGVFTDYAYISEATLSIRTGLTREQIYNILVTLTKRRIVDYIPHKKTPYIIYTRERQELRFVHIPPSVYEERKARYEARIKAMEEYVTSENVCRSRMLLRYFGEKNEHNCGQCDVCLSHRATDALTENSFDFEELKKKISELLTQKPLTPIEIADKIEAEKESISEVIQYLLEEGEWKMQDGMIHISK